MIRIALEPRQPPSTRVGVGARVVPGFDEWFLRCTAHDAAARPQSTVAAVGELLALLRAGDERPLAATLPLPQPAPAPLPVALPVAAPAPAAPAAPPPAPRHAAPPPPPRHGAPALQLAPAGPAPVPASPGAWAAAPSFRGDAALDGDGFPTTPAIAVPDHSSPSMARLSDAGVREGSAIPATSQTSSSWQQSAVRVGGRRRVALLASLGGAIGTLLLGLFVIIRIAFGPSDPDSDSATAGTGGPAVGTVAGSPASARPEPAASDASSQLGAPSAEVSAKETGQASAAASGDPSASTSSTSKPRVGAPRPEGKERVFEDF
jgi:hypothetical protein